jgi:hypothetical protein
LSLAEQPPLVARSRALHTDGTKGLDAGSIAPEMPQPRIEC